MRPSRAAHGKVVASCAFASGLGTESAQSLAAALHIPSCLRGFYLLHANDDVLVTFLELKASTATPGIDDIVDLDARIQSLTPDNDAARRSKLEGS